MIKTISIEGMSCGHCTGRVEKALNALEGVEVKLVSVEDKHAKVEVKDVTDGHLIEAIEDMGFEVIKIS